MAAKAKMKRLTYVADHFPPYLLQISGSATVFHMIFPPWSATSTPQPKGLSEIIQVIHGHETKHFQTWWPKITALYLACGQEIWTELSRNAHLSSEMRGPQL